ncbi:DNA replication terminus site binding protein [Kushneria avicenniae]|uniref:DNA replication terminus site binding protein n=1 Tax=Kushneria avicenniae TaxID=402385 RepID=A0A1I1FXK7_9GAMM|nr:DNA replication terminus site-binding protein [Kushneria avicenniae]SFC04197.1 DNA replication terminus site binding protein [Kushneria avicenniae]
MSPQYQLMAELERAFDDLVEATEALIATARQHPPAMWRFGGDADIDWLMRALTDYWYQDGQDGRATRDHVGVVMADDALLEHVCEVNRCKNAFSSQLSAARKLHPAMVAELKATLPFRHPVLHDHLKGSGMARLHLKQCWRRLPVADAPVSRIRLAWYSSGRSIKRMSVSEVEARLARLNNEAAHVKIQYQLLAALPDGEMLAQIQTQAPLMRANIFFREPLEDGHTRRAMNVALPLFVPSPDNRLPQINQPPSQPPEKRTRALRGDSKIESEPFIPSLRIHRYRR